MGFLEKLFGTYSEREVKKLQSIADKIEALEPSMQALTDKELQNKTVEFKERIAKGESLDSILPSNCTLKCFIPNTLQEASLQTANASGNILSKDSPLAILSLN